MNGEIHALEVRGERERPHKLLVILTAARNFFVISTKADVMDHVVFYSVHM